jgi:hypothetical protein
MFLRGKDAHGTEFLDLTKTLDISAAGAFIASPHSFRHNEIICLTVPAPPSPDPGLLPEPTPPIPARVRRQQSAGTFYLVGVEFVKPLD